MHKLTLFNNKKKLSLKRKQGSLMADTFRLLILSTKTVNYR